MWICLNDAFFSIVESEQDAAILKVRARRAGDIERYFPSYPVVQIPRSDYAFRAFVPRREAAQVIAEALETLDYGNFKDSVRDPDLHEAYADVWSVMAQLDARGGAYGFRHRS
jgi:hypothetical protein